MIASGFTPKILSSCRRLLAPVAVAALGFWAQPASALVTYAIDDGSAETSVGEGGPNSSDIIFLNEFPVAPNGQTIASISVAFGDPTTSPTNTALLGLPYSVLLYSDPSGTGNPDDATLVAFASGVITNVNSNTFLTTNITPTNITTSDFFVGFELQGQPPDTFPAGIDTSNPLLNRSYVTFGAAGTINPFDLAANQQPPETIQSVSGAPDGNWLIRANAVPEPSTWACVLASVAGGCLLFRRRSVA